MDRVQFFSSTRVAFQRRRSSARTVVMSDRTGGGETSPNRCLTESTYRGGSLATKLSGLEFFKDSFFSNEDKQPVIDSILEASEIKSDRMFVQLGLGDAHSTAGLIMALNELQSASNLVAIDSHPSSKFSWESLCSGLIGRCTARFYSDLSKYRAFNFSYFGPVWVLISGCPCYRCVKAYLKEWAHRIVIDGFLLVHQVNEAIEGTKTLSPYHPDVGLNVRHGGLRATDSTLKISDNFSVWHKSDAGNTKIWRCDR